MTRLGELNFREAYLPRHQGRAVYGLWEASGTITVNPMPHVVDTIVHECLHEVFPDYSERAIASLTGKIVRQLSEDNIQTIYAEYRRRVDEG